MSFRHVRHRTLCLGKDRRKIRAEGVKWDEVTILGQETYKGSRLALESLEIKLNGGNINRNKGQPELSEIWDAAISNFSKRKVEVRRGRPGQRMRYERARNYMNNIT